LPKKQVSVSRRNWLVKGLETLYLIHDSFIVGSALKKAGGKDFQDEVKNLESSHGPLDTSGGKWQEQLKPLAR